MNKQEAIDVLEVYKRNMAHILGDEDEKVKVIETCIMLVEEIEDSQRWIPVTERLPEYLTSVLDMNDYMTCKGNGVISILHWCDGWNCCLHDDGSIYRDSEIKGVVAWMPLPEPYKEEK